MPSSIEVGVAAIAAFLLGFLWYGPLLGERWCKAAGKKEKDCKPEPLPVIMSFVGWLATSAVFGWLVAMINHGSPSFVFGLAVVLWLAFVLPHEISGVLWAKRDKNLIWIDGGYSLVGMGVVALVFYLL